MWTARALFLVVFFFFLLDGSRGQEGSLSYDSDKRRSEGKKYISGVRRDACVVADRIFVE